MGYKPNLQELPKDRYYDLLHSGMLYEYYPEATGIFIADCIPSEVSIPNEGNDISTVKESGNALDRQEGGSHYKTLGIQPLEHTLANYGYIGLKAAVHTKVDKYLLRQKNSEIEDIKKSIHALEILLDAAIEEFGDG